MSLSQIAAYNYDAKPHTGMASKHTAGAEHSRDHTADHLDVVSVHLDRVTDANWKRVYQGEMTLDGPEGTLSIHVRFQYQPETTEAEQYEASVGVDDDTEVLHETRVYIDEAGELLGGQTTHTPIQIESAERTPGKFMDRCMMRLVTGLHLDYDWLVDPPSRDPPQTVVDLYHDL